jgi:histidyl-tRNA synthetase
MAKPSIPKGTRDFSPGDLKKRNYIFNTIREVYELYAYQQIETPSMEMLSTLMGKYGEEGDRLIFKILKRGEKLSASLHSADATEKNSEIKLSEEALRYDLTVPFARYVVMHQNEITFPFKRYQVQPVWRADRPQKGRYREFYQCDADVIGSNSLLNEIELIQMIAEVFSRLKIPVCIKINNRKLLEGIAESIGEKDKIIDITTAIDKLDKIGMDLVKEELLQRGLSASAIERLQPFLLLSGSTADKIEILKKSLKESDIGKKGIEEIEYIFSQLEALNFSKLNETSGIETELDLSLARGLNYYTGAIIEVKAKELQFGSICGGGRYDDLTGIFGLKNVSGVGISFGVDRIYDVMEQSRKSFEEESNTLSAMFVNFGEGEITMCQKYTSILRAHGIRAELYPDASKIKKQLDYADKNKISHVLFAGSVEIANGLIRVKTMNSGNEDQSMSLEEFIHMIKK